MRVSGGCINECAGDVLGFKIEFVFLTSETFGVHGGVLFFFFYMGGAVAYPQCVRARAAQA